MTPFQHGGNIAAFAQVCGCSPDEVIDLSSNINFVTPNVNVDFNTLPIASYPDYSELYERVAGYCGVAVEEMELFNGGSSAIFSLFAHLSECRGGGTPTYVSVYSPAYLEYKKAAERFGFAVHLIDRSSQMDVEVPKGSLVVFVNPATPDGAVYEMEPLLERWAARGCRVLVDESFLGFTSRPSVSCYLDRYPHLYILTSMTKYFGAAGMRIGALLSSETNIVALRRREPLWKLSSFDTAYLMGALDDATFSKRSAQANGAAKGWLLEVLERSPLIETIYPGEVNFVLVQLCGMQAEELQARLVPHRILVRDCANFDGLDSYHVRIAVKSIEQMRPLAEVLRG